MQALSGGRVTRVGRASVSIVAGRAEKAVGLAGAHQVSVICDVTLDRALADFDGLESSASGGMTDRHFLPAVFALLSPGGCSHGQGPSNGERRHEKVSGEKR